MSTKQKQPRTYRKITSQTVAQFKAAELEAGNATAAIRQIEPTRLAPKHRAFRIKTKQNQQDTNDFIDEQLQLIGVDSVNRLGKLVNSSDERVGLKAVTYAIDHLRGQAVRRSESKHLALTIETVLD